MTIVPGRRDDAERIVERLAKNKARYEAVEIVTGVPWWWVAIVHSLESGLDFHAHLHNGDPLTARTKQVPSGRPVKGEPPFSWEESAEDALRLKSLDKESDWSLPKALWNFERYNGFGYTKRDVNSPYIWSFSNQYRSGKYVSDGRFDANAISQQCGAAVLVRILMDRGLIAADPAPIALEVSRVATPATSLPSPAPVKEPAMTDLSPFFPLLEAYAPTIGAIVAGPVGARVAPLAVAGIHALADALDLDGQPTAGAVAQRLNEMPTAEVPAVLRAAEALVRAALPQPATPAPVQLPVPVAPPAPAQGLYVDPANSLIKLGVAALAAMFATKFGFDATVAQSWGDTLVPVVQGVAALAMSGLSGFSLWRSIAGANENTKAAGLKG
jgi:lysozyme family protein